MENQFKNRRITVSFDLIDNQTGISNEDIASRLSSVLSFWEDGRYDFPTELMFEGLKIALKMAIYNCIGKKLQKEFGGEVTERKDEDGRVVARSANWVIEQEKRSKDVWVSCQSGGINVKVDDRG